jgi:hypothetical protein
MAGTISQDDEPRTLADELIELCDGPDYGNHFVRALLRGLLVCSPILSLLGGLAVACAYQNWDWTPLVILASALVALIVLFALLGPHGQANLRRRRDVLLGQLACSTSSAEARVSWTAWLLDSGKRYDGSVHLVRGVLRFLWHQAATLPVTDPRGEIVLEIPVSRIAAIETEPARSLREWWSCGSPLVLVILRDGRRIRMGAHQSERLAEALRARVGRPEGTPVAPSPADFSLEEIGQSLVRRYPLVALVVKGQDVAAPFVVLHGATEDLRGALENARDTVVQERKALSPYSKGLLPAEPRGSVGNDEDLRPPRAERERAAQGP